MPIYTSGTRARGGSDEAGVKYLAVGRAFDRVILATYSAKPEGSAAAQQLHAVITRILCSTGAIDQHPRLTVTDRQVGTVHYDTERGFVFFCVTEGDYPQRIAFKCIASLKTSFVQQFGDSAEKSAEGGLTKPCRQLMSEVGAAFADVSKLERTVGIQRQVQEVTELVSGSINELLATQDNLQVLEDKTDALASQAQNFQRSARTLKRDQWWKNCKMKIAICLAITTVIAMIAIPLILQATQVAQAASDDDDDSSAAAAVPPAAPGQLPIFSPPPPPLRR